jgi:hypothetical protein
MEPANQKTAKLWKRLLRACARVLLLLLLVLSGCHFMLTGSPMPLFRIDRLRNAQRVAGIDGDAIILASRERGQQRATLPFINGIPTNAVFKAALKRGVELDASSGRAYGLLKIWHWCGNDSMRYDLRRVDLSALAGVLNPDMIAISTNDVFTHSMLKNLRDYRPKHLDEYTKFGWNISHLSDLQTLEYVFNEEEKERAASKLQGF